MVTYIYTDGFDCQLYDYALPQNHLTPLSQCIQWMGHTSSLINSPMTVFPSYLIVQSVLQPL